MSERSAKNIEYLLESASLASVALAIGASIAGALDAHPSALVFLSRAGLAFDLVFTLEFALRISGIYRGYAPARGTKTLSLLVLGLSSLIPLVFVSGPGVALFAPLGLFRLLRLGRPLLRRVRTSTNDGWLILVITVGACLSVASLGITESVSSARYRTVIAATRREISSLALELSHGDIKNLAERIPGLIAVSVDGSPVFSVAGEREIQPGNFEHISVGSMEIWFSTQRVRRVQVLSELLIYLFASVFIVIILTASKLKAPPDPREGFKGRAHDVKGVPIGKEELDGILGKAR